MVDFLIVGAQKSGTTSLHRYLSAHPEIEMPPNKEIDFFSNEKYFDRGIDYYLSFFKKKDDKNVICGEASPQYMYFDKTPELIRNFNPEMKIIMCLRDPVYRALSHYRMNCRREKEIRSFESAYNDFESGEDLNYEDAEYWYFRLGEYGRILDNYMKFFQREQILIVFSSDLKKNRDITLEKIQKFLGKSSLISREVFEIEYHQSGRRRFPWLSRGISRLAKISPRFNMMIKRLLGADRVYSILHKIETQWNVVPEKKGVSHELDLNLIRRIRSYYYNDSILLKELSGYDLPWETE